MTTSAQLKKGIAENAASLVDMKLVSKYAQIDTRVPYYCPNCMRGFEKEGGHLIGVSKYLDQFIKEETGRSVAEWEEVRKIKQAFKIEDMGGTG